MDLMQSDEEKLKQVRVLMAEANSIREKDKRLIETLLGNFYGKQLDVGIRYSRAYGALLSGDYFKLIKLPDGNYLFVIADISGHGLPAYTNLIRLNSAITLTLRDFEKTCVGACSINPQVLVNEITLKFTDLMAEIESDEFASVLFTFIYNDKDKFYLKFINRGMLFPLIIRKFQNTPLDVYNLNLREKGWSPVRGPLLGSVVRDIMKERYFQYPSCEFILYEGDRALFFTDGLSEAHRQGPAGGEEFGEVRIGDILRRCAHLSPQDAINRLFHDIYEFIGSPAQQKDDMSAIMIDFPPVRFPG